MNKNKSRICMAFGLLFSACLFLLSVAQAAEIGTNVVINTSVSNTSIIFSNISASGYFDVHSNAITFVSINYTNNELEINITSMVNLTSSNDGVDISEFPYLLSSSTARTKYIGNNASNVMNATVTVSTNCTNITGVSYSSNSYSQAYDPWFCNSNRLMLNITGIEPGNDNIISISSNDTLGAAQSAGSAAGGGGESTGRTAAVSDITAEPSMIKLSMKNGEIKTYGLLLGNSGSTRLILSFDAGKLNKYVMAFDDSIILGPNESKTVSLVFSVPAKENPDVIVGSIMFKSEYVTKAIPVILEITSKEPLFDVKIQVLDSSKEIKPGDYLGVEVNITNLGDILKVDAEVEYAIKDMENSIIDSSHETLAVEKEFTYQLLKTKYILAQW